MAEQEAGKELFDQWPERYDSWFTTPIGSLVKKYERDLLLDLLDPQKDDCILDVGCGTGVFTQAVLDCGARIVGLDISFPMLRQATRKIPEQSFVAVAGNMTSLPFSDGCFDKVYSMTAIEFVTDAQRAVDELNRVARSGAKIVLTTLNSLSPWAERRKKKAEGGHQLFQSMTFRSPTELLRVAPEGSRFKTAIHFQKDDDPVSAENCERQGMKNMKDTGAFVAVSWIKK
jgi:ubiquinone/menaquinone biosynthesis C-methylase UbiE